MIIKWSVKHRSIVLLLSIIILIAGGFLYVVMERQENPTVASPIAVIKCIYPGASPEDVEKLIIKPIENQIDEIPEIKRLESFSMDSVGVVKVTLKDISDSEIDKVWDDIKDDLDTVKSELPSDAQEPEMETDFTSSYGMILGLSAKDYTYEDLKTVATKLKDQLKEDPGVKAVDIDGEINQEIDINLDMVKLKQYGISPTTIGTALKARNINIPGGSLDIDQTKIPVEISGEYEDVEEIKNTIVDVNRETGAPVYLKNLAEVVQTEEKREVFTSMNHGRSLLINIKYMDEQNMVAIDQRLEKIIDDFKAKDLYANMELVTLTNQADFVKSAISLFESNLISAIILVVIVVIIFMGLRSAIVVSFPIPLVMALVFIYMYLTKIPLHQVSIASLIISLSLLVANGIVANDSMYLYLERRTDRFTACTKGVDEVKIAILTSTLTSIASFLPLAMMQGVAGKFVKSLPILVSIALFGSYITALTVVPSIGNHILKVKEKDTNSKKIMNKVKKLLRTEKIGTCFMNFYGNCLKIALKIPRMIISVFIALLIGSLAIVPSLDMQLFPPVERDQYTIDVTVQDGSDAQKTERIVNQIADILDKEPSVTSYAYKVGDGFPKYYVTFVSNDPASNKAQFLVNGSQNQINNLQRLFYKNIPGASINIRKLEIAVPVTYPIQVRVSGENINQLRKIAEEIKDKIYDVEGSKNIEDDYGYNSYKLKIKVNEEKANLVGITNYDIASTVRMAVNGLEISQMKQKDIEKDSLPIIIKIPEEQKNDRDILDNIFLTSQITNENVLLNQIASIETQTSLNKIVRRDSQRTITIGMFVENGYNTNRVMREVENRLADYSLPDGYTIHFGGESEERNDAFSSMKIPTVLAIVIIYLILVFQFGDLKKPLIIMGTIPLSFIGIIWGLKLTGYPIGFMALLGAISLMGVVVNNGIVLLDYIKLLVKDYDDTKEAIVEACKTRLRPIMIGMVTTVISLLPLAQSGGMLWAPMATSIIAGMLISSVLTLIVIPCAYFIIEGKKNRQVISKEETL